MFRLAATAVPVVTAVVEPRPEGLTSLGLELDWTAPPREVPELSFLVSVELVATPEFKTGRVRSTPPPRKTADEPPPL